MDDFNKVAEELLKQKQALQSKYDEARVSAIAHVQQIIKDFRIQASDLQFEGKVKKAGTRAPAAIKYRLPDGNTWTGKGQMKKEFKEYKNIHFRNLSDKDFLAKFTLDNPVPMKEPEKKEEVKPVAKK